MKKDKSEKFWDRVSKYHDSMAIDESYKKTLKITKKYLTPSDVVLAYGCATGLYSIEFSKHVKEIHGIDISPKMIEYAKKKALDNTTFTKSTIFEKYENERFDVILAFNVLHFIENDRKVMKRIKNLLKRRKKRPKSTV